MTNIKGNWHCTLNPSDFNKGLFGFNNKSFDKISLNKDIRCKRCISVYFFKGCPHCGNTFIKRDIVRITS